MSRYIIIGAGAVGAALAAGLSEAGIDAVLVSRGTTFETISRSGLHFTHAGRTRTLDVTVVDGPANVTLTPDDVLVLAVKSQDAPAALADWAWRPVGSDGGAAADLPILLLQNGLDSERSALRYFRRVIGGVALIGAKHVVAGEVLVANAPKIGQIVVGPYPTGGADGALTVLADAIVDDLRAAQWLSQRVDDIGSWLAWKLLHNTTFAVSVLAGTDAELDDLTERVRAETQQILSDSGFRIADPATELTYDPSGAAISADSGYGPRQPSTWQSFERGSGSEVDYLNGEVALLARLSGLHAPLNCALAHVLGRSAFAGEKPHTHTVGEVLAVAASTDAVPVG